MKREYIKPSMAVNSFDMTDNTNVIAPLSSIAQKSGTKATRYGLTLFDASELDLKS